MRHFLERGRYRLRTDRTELAESDFQDAEELNETDPEVYISQVSLLQQRLTELRNESEPNPDQRSKLLSQMKLLAELGLEVDPSRPEFHLFLADWAQSQRDFEQSSEHLQKALELARKKIGEVDITLISAAQNMVQNIEFKQAEMLIAQAELQETEQQKEVLLKQALEEISRLRLINLQRTKPDEVLAWKLEFLETNVHIARSEWRQAIPKLGRVRNAVLTSGGVGDQSLFLRQVDSSVARCYSMLGNPDRQIVVWRRALEADPLWKYGRLELARALAAAGRVEAAINEYNLLGDVPEGMVELARLILNRETAKDQAERSWAPVIELLDAAEKLRQERSLPPSLQLDVLRIELLWQQGHRDEALKILAQAEKDHTESASAIKG